VDPGAFSPRLRGKTVPRRAQTRRTIFINGIRCNPSKHRAQACAVSAVSGGKVWGVYNASDGLTGDLLKCLGDKFTSKWGMTISALGAKVGAFISGIDKQVAVRQELIEALQDGSPPTASMFELLSSRGFEDARIFAHSQGNIITCNALNALAVLRGDGALKDLTVYGFGSPVTFWPNQVDVRLHGFANDPITYLSLVHTDTNRSRYGTTTYMADKAGNTEVIQKWEDDRWTDYVNPDAFLSHAFYIYLEAYWDELAEELRS
jgi:hypothetical protein